jgi:thiosulfate dehydrogenase (quinone) large subunit
MSTTHLPSDIDVHVEQQDVVTHSTARRALAALRIGFGVTFLWAFFDKLLALGYATGVNPETGAVDRFGPDAWINGGSPTFGFLTFGVPADNPFQSFFNGLAGDTWVDWLFMLSLLGIGLTLTSGVGMRIGAASGALLYLMMWVASMPLENNPVVDEHLLGALTMVVLATTLAGDTWGLGKRWARTSLIRRHEVLR